MSTNDNLADIMSKHNLTAAEVAELLTCSKHTVDAWRAKPESPKRRTMPAALLELLELKLARKAA